MMLYHAYGLQLASDWFLPFPEERVPKSPCISILRGTKPLIAADDEPQWGKHIATKDGSDYIRWPELFEFLISPDGGRIVGRQLSDVATEAFQTYLLGQVLSFALVKQGIEPLHATGVVIDGKAIAFLGDCGYGKSSLAAAFLKEGYQLLTDDVLVLKAEGTQLFAYPGSPRIKLFPEAADMLLKDRGRGIPMNPFTQKFILQLKSSQYADSRKPLKALYVLRSAHASHAVKRSIVRRITGRRAILAILANTFNARIRTPDRLARQFRHAAQVCATIPIKSLSRPFDLQRLPEAVEAVCSDLQSN
jgi:hypothetical protein